MTTSSEIQRKLAEQLGKKEETVQEAKSEDQTFPEPVFPEHDNTKKFSDVFGWVPTTIPDIQIRVFEGPAPDVNKSYIFPRAETEMFVLALENSWKPVCTGPSGCGKTELARQVAARTNRPFEMFSFNRHLELADIIGEKDLQDGSTEFVDGPLTKAIQTNALIVFDEYSRATAAVTMGLQRYTDSGELFIAGRFGESGVDHEQSDVLVSHPDSNLCVCDNTLGLGDGMDKYAAANVQDVSTLNRWEVNINMNYLTNRQEFAFIVEQQPDMPVDVADKLASISELMHQAFQTGDLPVPFSMRNLKVVSQLAMQLREPVQALEWNYVNSLDDESKVVARELIRTVFGN